MKSERDLDITKMSPAATAVTAVGLALVLKGSADIDSLDGMKKVLIGRSFDLADGWIARRLGQESDAGAFADAAADKVGIAAISIAAWAKDAIPKPVITTIVAKNALSAALTFVHGRRHPDESFRPTKWGKVSVAADSIAYPAYLSATALEHDRPRTAKAMRLIGHAAVATSVITGGVSLGQYAQRTFSD